MYKLYFTMTKTIKKLKSFHMKIETELLGWRQETDDNFCNSDSDPTTIFEMMQKSNFVVAKHKTEPIGQPEIYLA